MRAPSSTQGAQSVTFWSRLLAGVAIGVWIWSLYLPAIFLYRDEAGIFGMLILLLGWVGTTAPNLAWFANPLFVWAAVRLLVFRGTPAVAAPLAALVALDTFRLQSAATTEAGHASAVYGYGTGCIAWFAALALLLVATGQRQAEAGRPMFGARTRRGAVLRVLGALSLIVLLSVSGLLAVHDRRDANAAERARLGRGVVFKRGPVCSLEQPRPTRALALTGPLEIGRDGLRPPFGALRSLLLWGVPAVRVDGADYRFIERAGLQVLTATAARGQPSARLAGALHPVAGVGRPQIRITLGDSHTGETILAGRWTPEGDRGRYCPDYSRAPRVGDPPRAALAAALALEPPGASFALESDDREPPRTLSATLIATPAATPVTTRQRDRATDTPTVVTVNRDCPAGTGFPTPASPLPFENAFADVPFRIGETYYYPPRDPAARAAVCAGGHAYLYALRWRKERRTLWLEKRTLDDFSFVWRTVVDIADPDALLARRGIEVVRVTEVGEHLSLGLVNPSTNERFTVDATTRSPANAGES